VKRFQQLLSILLSLAVVAVAHPVLDITLAVAVLVDTVLR
jgi:hypothetical protein